MTSPDYTFPKSEHLCLKKQFELLVKSGKSFLVYPFKVVYIEPDELEVPVKIGISVSKKYSKRAVRRNRIKRLTREAYRLNKSVLHEFLSSENKKLILLFVYVGKEEYDYNFMQQKICLVLKKLKTLL